MTVTLPFITYLQNATQRADVAEAELQKEIVARRTAIEHERKFAYRRFNFIRAVTDGVATAENSEMAVANAQAVMRNRLGWTTDSEPRQTALEAFAPVALAIFAAVAPPETEPPEEDEKADVVDELSAFEKRYEAQSGTPFWVLFENYIPETPLVDF